VPERAPFDRIVATVGCSDLSPAWAGQLAKGGRMLVPLEHAGGHPLYLLRNQHGRLQGRVASWSAFMPVRGPLHVDALWAIGVLQLESGEVVHRRDPWPGFAAAGRFPGVTAPPTRWTSASISAWSTGAPAGGLAGSG
jgi:hypothetical protein